MTFKMGKTSKTGYNFLKNSNAFINICYGAVRSGKTIICTFRFLQHILLSKHEKFLLCGKNRDTIERNIINDFIDIIEQYYTVDYNKIDGKIHINTREGVKTCYIVGLNDERVTDKIKGMTVAGAYVDELTTVPKSAFEMLTTRCSLPDSKIFCTTNPASPYHWVYTDYIANEELIKSDTVKSWQFRIDENPHLTNEYIKRMKTLYPPNTPYYKQYIF